MRIRATSSFLWLGMVACGWPVSPAHAQVSGTTSVEQNTSIYDHDYFAGTTPANAYEMVQRLPGFAIVEADSDVRGYAAAQGNVLIDGARPASKREDIAHLLKRIRPASVDRIELIRSATAGIDMAGYPVLANIVRRQEASSEAAVELGVVASTDGWVAPQGQLEYGRRWDEYALDLALKLEPELDDDSGDGTIRAVAPDGRVVEDSLLDTRKIQDKGEASAAWRQPLAGGQLALNAAVRSEQARTDTGIASIAPAAGMETIAEDEDLLEAELGTRYVRQLGERTTMELVATQLLGQLDNREHSLEDGGAETFEEKTDTGETIGRIELTHDWSDTWSFASSLEGAFNFLESEARLEQDGAPVFLPGSDVRIEEMRAEGTVAATCKPMDAWVIETGLRIERSAISQTGDSPLQRSFTYAKPRVALRWDANDRNQLRLSLSREVGQLDFADFVASASLDTGVVTAGNAELEPDKTWRTTVAWEHHFWTDAAVTLAWTHDEISDVIDRVLVVTPDDVFDAPGNIGSGRRDTLALELSAPLDRLGFTGAHIRSSLLRRTSRVTDPVTGDRRAISEEKPVEGTIALTQDVPALRLNWGIEIDHIAEQETKYRFDEISRSSEGVGWTLFVEQRIGARWRVRAEATDLFGRDFVETRDKYDGPRSTFPVEEIERRNRTTPGYVSLTFRRNMGG